MSILETRLGASEVSEKFVWGGGGMCVGKQNLLKCFGASFAFGLGLWTLCQGQAFSISRHQYEISN